MTFSLCRLRLSSFEVVVGMPYLAKWFLSLGLCAGFGEGWFGAAPNISNTSSVDENRTVWVQWLDWANDHVDTLSFAGSEWTSWASSWTAPQRPQRTGFSWDGGLCLLLDTIVGIIGWALFGNAWPGVRTGCQRAFLDSGFAWFLFGGTLPMGYLLASRFLSHGGGPRCRVDGLAGCQESGHLGLLGTASRYGGVPEATGANFLGPGTGKIPETTDLTTFKKVGNTEKWVLVRREGRVAVFKVGSDSQTIRTAGLYVPVEADTWRGDREIVDACAGHDKVHLCRSLQCNEKGQHFKEYSLAREFDAEKFQLKGAELGAAEAGRTLWAWLWASRPSLPSRPPLEFCSESRQKSLSSVRDTV